MIFPADCPQQLSVTLLYLGLLKAFTNLALATTKTLITDIVGIHLNQDGNLVDNYLTNWMTLKSDLHI